MPDDSVRHLAVGLLAKHLRARGVQRRPPYRRAQCRLRPRRGPGVRPPRLPAAARRREADVRLQEGGARRVAATVRSALPPCTALGCRRRASMGSALLRSSCAPFSPPPRRSPEGCAVAGASGVPALAHSSVGRRGFAARWEIRASRVFGAAFAAHACRTLPIQGGSHCRFRAGCGAQALCGPARCFCCGLPCADVTSFLSHVVARRHVVSRSFLVAGQDAVARQCLTLYV